MTLILLLIAFGSVVAATLPLGVGLLAISMTMAVLHCSLITCTFSILVGNLATMLGLGLGIDYALLMVSRFREALAAGHDANRSADLAAGQAGRTLIISAATVAIGFAALLTVADQRIELNWSGRLACGFDERADLHMHSAVDSWTPGRSREFLRLHLPALWRSSTGGILTTPKARWHWWGML